MSGVQSITESAAGGGFACWWLGDVARWGFGFWGGWGMELTAEGCYAEALRRIEQEGLKLSGELNLSELYELQRLPPEIAQLTHLQRLECDFTSVSDLSPLGSLTALRTFNCWKTQISDLAPLASLMTLHFLDCDGTQVTDLAPLALLSALHSLDCSRTKIRDLQPLLALEKLISLRVERCDLTKTNSNFFLQCQFQNLYAEGTNIPSIPNEVLSKGYNDNCLPRLRAHLLDMQSGSSPLNHAKLMFLGNGRVGKTQLCRRLLDKEFDATISSTHGIQVHLLTQETQNWHLWDFGGQEIYHSTHALFMRTRAVFVLVWSPDCEADTQHETHGMQFRNHSLEYWVDYVRHSSGTDCPLLIVQTRCEKASDEVRSLPLPAGALDDFAWCKVIQYSSMNNRGRGALDDALQDAHQFLLDQHPVLMGAGRLQVLQTLCEWRDADSGLANAAKLHRTLSQEEFVALCEDTGNISSPPALLDYLHHAGIVFYQSGMFNEQIILDQGWALEAIYTVFDRDNCVRQLQYMQGRFTRSLLANLVWQQHSEGEQELFLSMMCSCGVAFVYQKGDKERETEYIAPDWLPEKAKIEQELEEKWGEAEPCELAEFEYALLHPGILRSVIVAIGRIAGVNALYWRGGVCVYERNTRSRALIEQIHTQGWRGQIRLRTQGPQAKDLLAALQDLLEQHTRDWKMKMQKRDEPTPAPSQPLAFVAEPSTQVQYAVSYAWDSVSPDLVDQLCTAAEARGIRMLRDTKDVGIGDSLSKFMQQLATQDRVFVILSEKYLKSPNCMFELFEIWRHAKGDEERFAQTVRLYRQKDADIFSIEARLAHADYWQERVNKLQSSLAGKANLLSPRDLQQFKQMQDFANRVGDILSLFADRLQVKDFDELVRHGLE